MDELNNLIDILTQDVNNLGSAIAAISIPGNKMQEIVENFVPIQFAISNFEKYVKQISPAEEIQPETIVE